MTVPETIASAAAGAPADPSAFLANDPFSILWGFVFVLAVLLLFSIVTAILGAIFKQGPAIHNGIYNSLCAFLPKGFVEAFLPAPEVREPTTHLKAPRGPSLPTPAGSVPDVEPELVAVIAAAVHLTLHEPVRVVAIRPASESGWAAEGRRQIFSSHRVR